MILSNTMFCTLNIPADVQVQAAKTYISSGI